MEEVKSVNFFNISKEKNESYQSFLTKLMAIWDESKYSDTSILKDKILDNVNNDDFRQQILAAKEFDVPKFLALCMSFDSLDVKEDEIKIAEGVKALEEKNSESFFLPFSEVVLNSMPKETVSFLRSMLADNSEFVRKMYNGMDNVVFEFLSMRDTIKKSLDLIVQDLKDGRWGKFTGNISVSSLNTFLYGMSNSLDIFVHYAAGNSITFQQYLRTIDRLKSFQIHHVDSNIIFSTHNKSGISCNIICAAPSFDVSSLQKYFSSSEITKFIVTIILWLENCLKTKPTTKDIVKLILCYLKTNFPNQEKLPDFDFKQNLVNFMNFVFKMQLKDIYVYNFRDNNGTIFEYDIDGFNGLVQPNKRFFEASAIFMEYIY